MIVGRCPGCSIQHNTITHSNNFSNSSFAALMLSVFRVDGNYTGADVSYNTIDCGSQKRCGFGLYIGSDSWVENFPFTNFGGAVHDNTIRNAQQGVNIDEAYHADPQHLMKIYNNVVEDNGSISNTSCGARSTNAYNKGERSDFDNSKDSIGTTYTTSDWDGCIPNWWNQ